MGINVPADRGPYFAFCGVALRIHNNRCIKNPIQSIADQETRLKQQWIATLWADSR
jgi:hypothetical protein